MPGENGWDHVVVVGAGFGGLSAARVLSERFRRVTVVDQDLITEDTEHHNGVPQARHAHVLLALGGRILEELFPGLRAEFTGLGAPCYDLNGAGRFLFHSGWGPAGDIGVQAQAFTRGGLERALRTRVTARPNVTITPGFRVEGLCWDATGTRVTGVRGTDRSLEADLVVNSTGRLSSVATWLSEAGFDVPEPLVVDSAAVYTSRVYELPAERHLPWRVAGELPHATDIRRGGVAVTAERGRLIVSLLGVAGDAAPTDEEGFLDFARSLRNPHVAEVIDMAVPAGPIYRMRRLDNRWTPFHRMRDWPDRLVCLGDAVCALNPIYGQGMTVAAIQALRLRDMLSRAEDLTGLARRYQLRAAAALSQPWLIATSADLGWTPGPIPLHPRVVKWYLDKVVEAIPRDIHVLSRFYRAAQLLDGPTVLTHPRVLARVLQQCLPTRRD